MSNVLNQFSKINPDNTKINPEYTYIPFEEKVIEIIKNTDKSLIEKIKCNKSQLNKLIIWSSSKYNDYKKSEVIEKIINSFKEKKDYVKEFRSGCYSYSAHYSKSVKCNFTSSEFTLVITMGKAYIINSVSDIKNDFYKNNTLKIIELI